VIMQVIDNIDSHVTSSDHFRFTWFPNTNRCAVFDIRRTTQVSYYINTQYYQSMMYIETLLINDLGIQVHSR